MRTGRRLALVAAIIAEMITLVAIVMVFRSVGTNGWQWNLINWSGWFVPRAQEERIISLEELTGPLRIYNDQGKVQVTTGSAPYAMRAKIYAYGMNKDAAQKALSAVKIATATDANGMSITVRSPNGMGRAPYADLEVVVPANATVFVDANMGDVDIEDFVGIINVVANMGRIDLDSVQGNVDVRANMGSIDLKAMQVQDSLFVNADMGSIDFRGTLGKQNSFAANMGSITLQLADQHPALALDAAWDMGSYTNRLPFTGNEGRRSVIGTLGEGVVSGDLKMRADMGSISIR